MSRLLLFHDFASPFCRLAAQIAPAAAARTGLELRPVPFELRPAPLPLPGPGALDAEELETAASLAREWGLDLGEVHRLPRTRKAHEAVAYARTKGAGEAVLAGLYDALWRDGLDLSRLDVLADVSAAAGLDREAVHVALGVEDLAEEVVQEQGAAAAAGLTGVPALQVRDVVATGLFSLEEMVAWIEENR